MNEQSHAPIADLSYCEKMGYDCGKHGPSMTNCNFRIFRTFEGKEAWERGKLRAEEESK